MPEERPEHDVLIAFGSNLGDPYLQYERAIENLIASLELDGEALIKYSDPVITAPVGGPLDQPPYVNGAVRLKTCLEPAQLHERLIAIEQALGRQRRHRWGARKADLDLILFGNLQLKSPELDIPHPRMSFRRFVLEPSLQIAADMIHPPSGKSLRELIDILNTNPDRILVVVPRTVSVNWNVSALAKNEKTSGWTIDCVDKEDGYAKELMNPAKLVVFPDLPAESQADTDLLEQAGKHPGPTLAVSSGLQEDFETEVLAAIDGMSR